MVTIDDYGDLVDEYNPPPFWGWVLWIVIVIAVFEGCMRRGIPS